VKLVEPADALPLPKSPALHKLDPGSTLLVVLGQTFHNELTAQPPAPPPAHKDAYVRYDAAPGTDLLQPLQKKVPFKLEVPTVLERTSNADTCCGDKPVRMYWISPHKKAVRLVFKTGANEYWGVEETSYDDAPVLPTRPRRARVRPLLLGSAPAHGRPPHPQGELLGREHAARLALQRDDARDRERSEAHGHGRPVESRA
jgi:hypothetical protein